MAELPLRHANKKDAPGQMQPECTALPSLNFLSKGSGNLVSVPGTVPSHALLCCPIFHNNAFFQGLTITEERDFNNPPSQPCAAQGLVATVTVCMYY